MNNSFKLIITEEAVEFSQESLLIGVCQDEQ